MDAPKAPELMGILLGRLVSAGIFTLNEIGNLLQVAGERSGEVREEGHALPIFGAVLNTYREEKGEEQMVEVYKKSGLVIESLVTPSEDRVTTVEQFLKRKNLQKLQPVRERLSPSPANT